jgi:hypothetical protein
MPEAGAGLRTSASHRDSAARGDRSRDRVIRAPSAIRRGLLTVALILVLVLLVLAIVASAAALPLPRIS